jgi:RNA polymerase sigma factor (sigma-70 family)
MASDQVRAAALGYALADWRVLPLHGVSEAGTCTCGWEPSGSDVDHPTGKHPHIKEWRTAASNHIETVTAWFARWPDANVGLVTGDAFDVIDIDGEVGIASMKQALGPDELAALRATFHVRTGRAEAGWHYYVAPTGLRNGAGLLPGVDLRAAGGYVVAPPSLHASGRTYTPSDPGGLIEIHAAPARLLDIFVDAQTVGAEANLTELHSHSVTDGRSAKSSRSRRVSNPEHYRDQVMVAILSDLEAAPAHTGNDRLNRAAFRLYQFVFAGLVSDADAASQLTSAMSKRSGRLARPLDAAEMARTIASARHGAAVRPDLALVEAVERGTGTAAPITAATRRQASDLDNLLAFSPDQRSLYDQVITALAQVASDLAATGMSRDAAARRVVRALAGRAPDFHRLVASGSLLRGDVTKMNGVDVLTWAVAAAVGRVDGISPEHLADANARMALLIEAAAKGVDDVGLTEALARVSNPAEPTVARPENSISPRAEPVPHPESGQPAARADGEATTEERPPSLPSVRRGDLEVDLTGTEDDPEAILGTVFQALGLSADPTFGLLELGLAHHGQLEAFRHAVMELSGLPWAEVSTGDPTEAVATMATAMHHLDPSYPDPAQLRVTSPVPPSLSSDLVAQHIIDALGVFSIDTMQIASTLPAWLQTACHTAGIDVARRPRVPKVRQPQLVGADLTDQQVDDLVTEMRTGDIEEAHRAKGLVMERLEPLIGAGLTRAGLSGVDRDDARSAAQEAMLRVLDHYDPAGSAKLTTYAFPRIRGAILNYVARERGDQFGSLEAERERPPAVSFDRDDDDEEGTSLAERVADDRAADPSAEAEGRDATERITTLLGALPEQERQVLSWRFGLGSGGEGLSYDQIGRRLDVTGEMARRIEARALEMARSGAAGGMLGDTSASHRSPPAGVDQLATNARRLRRTVIDGQKVSLDTAISLAIAHERELHPNHVAQLEQATPGGLPHSLRSAIKGAREGGQRKPTPPPAPRPVPVDQPSPQLAGWAS